MRHSDGLQPILPFSYDAALLEMIITGTRLPQQSPSKRQRIASSPGNASDDVASSPYLFWAESPSAKEAYLDDDVEEYWPAKVKDDFIDQYDSSISATFKILEIPYIAFTMDNVVPESDVIFERTLKESLELSGRKRN